MDTWRFPDGRSGAGGTPLPLSLAAMTALVLTLAACSGEGRVAGSSRSALEDLRATSAATQALKSFRAGEGSFVVWLTRLTRNLLIDHYRRGKMQRLTDSIEGQLPRLEEESAHYRTDAALSGREASEILQAALRKLSPELREAVILRDLEDLEYKEIAEVLKVPEGTVKSRINRGRKELARHRRILEGQAPASAADDRRSRDRQEASYAKD